MSGGGGGSSETTVSQELTGRQKRLLDLAFPFFERLLEPGSIRNLQGTLFGRSTVPGFNPRQREAQRLAAGQARGAQTSVANTAREALQFFLGPGLDPTTNPNLQATIEAAQRPLFQNLTESALPAIRGEARLAGNIGGSRQGIAEGLATGRTAQAAGDVAANIANQGFQRALQAGVGALSLAPQTGQLQLAPAQTLAAVGDQRRALAQAQLIDVLNRGAGSELLPFTLANEISRIAFGLPGGGTTTTASLGGGGFSPIQGALGGAGLGLAGSTLFGFNPLLGLGAGALLGGLSGVFS